MKNPTHLSVVVVTFCMNLSVASCCLADGAQNHTSDVKGAQALVEFPSRPSPEWRLPSETQITQLKPLVANWSQLKKSTHLEMTSYNGVSARVAIQEVEGLASDTVYVFVPGILSEAADWRFVAGALKGERELWLVDLPGCGASDSLEPKAAGRGGFSPRALAERILQAVEARLDARPEVSRLLLVGHSLGGMLTLRMFVDDNVRERHPKVLSRVVGMVLLAPGDVVVTQATDTWKAFLGIDPVKARLGSALEILQGKVVGSLRASFNQPDWASRELAEEGVRLLQNGSRRRAMQQILIEAVPWRTFGKQVDWPAIDPLEAGYRNVAVPALIIWGKCDQTLPEPTGHKLNDQLPNARLVLLANSMHLLQIERPALCGELLRQFHRQLTDGNLADARSIQAVEPGAEVRGLMAIRLASHAGTD